MSRHKSVISAIAAVSRNGMLGKGQWLPWDIPDDVAYFEQMIEGAALVVGRLTYGTMTFFPADTYVVSRQSDLLLHPGSYRVDSVEKALSTAAGTGKPVFVIGGAGIYEAAWPYCQYFYMTHIEHDFPGDTRFPESIPLSCWQRVEAQEKQLFERNLGEKLRCRFVTYQQPTPRYPENNIAN